MWWKRRKIEGLVAASFYEELSDSERRDLDAAFAASPSLKAEAETLGRLVQGMPAVQPQLDVDLRETLRERLAEAESGDLGWKRRNLVLSGAFALAVLAFVGYGFWSNRVNETGGEPGTVAKAPATLMEKTFLAADRYLANHEPARAYEILKANVKAQPNDPMAPYAQLRLANLAFDMGLYPEALDAFNKMMTEPYHHILVESPEREQRAVQRRDLLAEAKKVNFRSLYALDSARRDRGNEIPRLEEVIVDNQETLVADLAAEEMGRLLLAKSAENGDSTDAYLNAMKAAREQCTNPYAVALLDYKIGAIYQNKLQDYAAAKSHYRRALENPVLARRAKDALGSLPGVAD